MPQTSDFIMEKPKNRPWKVLKSEYLARRPWFTVRHESLELPDGRRVPDYYVFEYPDWIKTTMSSNIPTGSTSPPLPGRGSSC